jgi:hypothetical protein
MTKEEPERSVGSNRLMETSDNVVIDTSDRINHTKFMFVYNALENGWRVHKKMDNVYVFSRNHHRRREYFQDDYLALFVQMNLGL